MLAISASETLTPFSSIRVSSTHSTLSPALIIAAPINSITVLRSLNWRPRQFWMILQNSQCSILVHPDVRGW